MTLVIESETRSLSELARVIAEEDEAVRTSAASMIHHAIRAGEALLEAKKQVPRGQFQQWLIENFHSNPDAQWASAHLYAYMRIARHKDYVLESGVSTLADARRILSAAHKTQGNGHVLLDLDEDVIRMVRQGKLTQKEAAERLGVSAPTIRNRLDGGRRNREKGQKLREARKALAREQREARIRKAGGAIAESYALVRRALQELDRAHAEAADREVRAAIGAAIARLHSAEDQIAKAVKLS